MNVILKVDNLSKRFKTRGIFNDDGIVKAVDGISFSIEDGTTFGLVGESGSGKTTVAKLIVGILKADEGTISFGGDADIVFQDPSSSLNPRMTIRKIVGESLYVRGVNKQEIASRVKESLLLVKLDPDVALDKYPHQFSGGERQRIAIARSLIRRPALIVLDEPVSSLDVSIQAEVLNLLKDLQEEIGLTYLFISHDLRVVEFMSDVVGVMNQGKLCEIASSRDIYQNPQNEYTRRLLQAIPKM